jgi:hypothetical protein
MYSKTSKQIKNLKNEAELFRFRFQNTQDELFNAHCLLMEAEKRAMEAEKRAEEAEFSMLLAILLS